jgi:hypothetical protein
MNSTLMRHNKLANFLLMSLCAQTYKPDKEAIQCAIAKYKMEHNIID